MLIIYHCSSAQIFSALQEVDTREYLSEVMPDWLHKHASSETETVKNALRFKELSLF